MKTQKQIGRGTTGSVQGIHPRLDDVSLKCLMSAQAVHREHGGNFSQNVIVRRALRFYSSYLEAELTDYWREELETFRAAKGSP